MIDELDTLILGTCATIVIGLVLGLIVLCALWHHATRRTNRLIDRDDLAAVLARRKGGASCQR